MGSLFFEGLVLQASLIFALGAQNIFVLEAGMRRQNHLVVSLVCFLCDTALILLGVAGAATIFSKFPHLKIFVGVLGVSFLFAYGVSKLVSNDAAFKKIDTEKIETTLKKSIILAATFSILNPHAYLDAFVLIGGFSSKYASLQDRIVLGLGAGVYSGVWFLILSTLSSVMKPLLENPRRMKAIMSVAGFVLIFLSVKLGLDVMSWIQLDLNPHLAINSIGSFPVSPGNVFTAIIY